MYKKIISLFIIFIVLFAISFVPVYSYPINEKDISDNKKIESSYNNLIKIEDIVEKLEIKISNNENPKEEIINLLSFPEIRDIILKISDEDTLHTIESLLSDENIFSKFSDIKNYKVKFDEINSIYNISQFKNELSEYKASNYSNFNIFSVFNESNITDKYLNERLNDWNEYLEQNQIIKSIISKYGVEPPSTYFVVLFALTIIIWGFTWGVFSAYNPEIFCYVYMIIEAFIVGIGASISMGYLFSIDLPFFNNIVNFLCNVSNINYEELIAISSSLTCLIVIAVFILLCNFSEKFIAICSGLWITIPPILIAIVLDKIIY